MIATTILAGYLGAGKTTLLNRLLAASDQPIAVLVNDFGELNIDAALIKNQHELVLELSNGCICCSINDDIGAALEVIKTSKVEQLIIEASGVALPEKIANYARNWPGFQLRSVVSLVDGSDITRLAQDKFVGELVQLQMQQADQVLLNRLEPGLSIPQTVMKHARQIQLIDAIDLSSMLVLSNVARPFHLSRQACSVALTTQTIHNPCNLSRQKMDAFLASHPEIHRAKGWFRDETGAAWLLQMSATARNYSISEAPPSSGLVFISSKPLDTSELICEN